MVRIGRWFATSLLLGGCVLISGCATSPEGKASWQKFERAIERGIYFRTPHLRPHSHPYYNPDMYVDPGRVDAGRYKMPERTSRAERAENDQSGRYYYDSTGNRHER
jgi:hypothetical protein